MLRMRSSISFAWCSFRKDPKVLDVQASHPLKLLEMKFLPIEANQRCKPLLAIDDFVAATGHLAEGDWGYVDFETLRLDQPSGSFGLRSQTYSR